VVKAVNMKTWEKVRNKMGKEQFKDGKRVIRIYKALDRKLKIKQNQPN
jgi:hypothetical protein